MSIRTTIGKGLLLAVLLLGVALRMGAQSSRIKTILNDYFKNYTTESYSNDLKYSMQRVLVSDANRTVRVTANEVFGMQPFTPEVVDSIYAHVQQILPSPYNTYTLTILVGNYDIRDLVTAAWTGTPSEGRHWGEAEYRGLSWTENLSLPFLPKQGLQGRHLSLAASHGKYYVSGEHSWKWQRPHLFCTTEDLLTQSIAVPFLYPMLERAGAIVYTPRERDWQRNEVVVDNDQPDQNGLYEERQGRFEWKTHEVGFTNRHAVLTDFDDPHHEGTARIALVQTSEQQLSEATWTPQIPKDGLYAVYVSYPQLPNAVPDATYQILHSGILTEVRVNQQMGGGTWVYLGTFDFTANNVLQNHITLTNHSHYQGVVAADAIRLGGGMSHVARKAVKRSKNDTCSNQPIGSGVPRHLEAARYSAMWNGLSREQFSVKEGFSDYGDDINVRGIATNYMARGSVYLPGDSGLSVPLELSLALHSDAGFRKEFEHIGSLAVYTSAEDDGLLPGGQSRLASRDFCDILLQQVTSDIRLQYGLWTRRQLYDRNYGETRVPRVPSAILEMFSHQNYADLVRALDPVFKFRLSRSIYKGILRFVTLQHSDPKVPNDLKDSKDFKDFKAPYTVAPLPINSFAAEADIINHRIRLTWHPTPDELEPSALPTSYIIYVRAGDNGWDNGRVVNQPVFDFVPEDNQLYQFRVEAVNDGGRSMPSETLCARLSQQSTAPRLLIMNGFQRLAAPQAVCTTDSCGFDMLRDPGVPYIHTTEFCGSQLCFDWAGIGKEKEDGMGFSGTELEGMLILGNTFDYPTLHAQDFLAAGDYNISSCSRQAVEEERVQVDAYRLLDIILGAQREDGYSSLTYKTFTPALQAVLRNYTRGGGALLTSGAYIGTDMQTDSDRQFTRKVLHFLPDGEFCAPADTLAPEHNILPIEGMNTQMSYVMRPNEHHLSTAYVSTLRPDQHAFATLVYSPTRQCAAVAYKGTDYACISLGFPLEQIQETDVRRDLMRAFLEFLTPPQPSPTGEGV